MLKARIIPCLDVKDGRVVKGTKFTDLRDAGDPVEVAAAYDHAGADELCFLDISASHENRVAVDQHCPHSTISAEAAYHVTLRQITVDHTGAMKKGQRIG